MVDVTNTQITPLRDSDGNLIDPVIVVLNEPLISQAAQLTGVGVVGNASTGIPVFKLPWVISSRFAGFLGPKQTPPPLSGDTWEDYLHDIIAGVTGLNPTLVRPGWQVRPPNQPNIDINWVGFRITNVSADWMPAIVHDDKGDGQDLLQRFEISTVLCSFYGPQADIYAGYLRDGLFIWQNQSALTEANVGLVEFTDFVSAPELYRNEWLNKVDTNMILRREIRRNYPVLNLLKAHGRVIANTPGKRAFRTSFSIND